MRPGGEYFLEPAEAAQRRYEALRCYFVEEARAEQVGTKRAGLQLLPHLLQKLDNLSTLGDRCRAHPVHSGGS